MDKKTKIKVAIAIAIVVIAVIFVLMVIFVKGNRSSKNTNIPTKTGTEANSDNGSNGSSTGNNGNSSSGNEDEGNNNSNDSNNNSSNGEFKSIGLKDNTLVKIDSDLNCEEVKNVENSNIKGYACSNGKIYVAYNTKVDCIDIETGSGETIYNFSTNAYKEGLTVVDDKLYFITEDSKLVEYSISEDRETILIGNNESKMGNGNSFAIDTLRNKIYLNASIPMENEEGETELQAGIFVLDNTSNSVTKVVDGLAEPGGDLIIDGDILMIELDNTGKNYLYNIVNNTIVEVGDTKSTGKNEARLKGKSAIYQGNVFVTDESAINVLDATGTVSVENWFIADVGSFIYEIGMISDTKLEIVLARMDDSGNSVVYKTKVIDATTGTTSEIDASYYDLVLVK